MGCTHHRKILPPIVVTPCSIVPVTASGTQNRYALLTTWRFNIAARGGFCGAASNFNCSLLSLERPPTPFNARRAAGWPRQRQGAEGGIPNEWTYPNAPAGSRHGRHSAAAASGG